MTTDAFSGFLIFNRSTIFLLFNYLIEKLLIG
jgi:hypothetical protein